MRTSAAAVPTDYSPHHEPFQYYASTANPTHLPPTSVAMIGHQDQANHQYDLRDFWAAADANNLPAVSYLKAAEYQDGHAGYSDPLDEQTWLVDTINQLEQLPSWKSTAVVILYDDSDGWYDHQIGPIINQSQTSLDALTEPACAAAMRLPPARRAAAAWVHASRCWSSRPTAGPITLTGPSPTQASVVKFIEDNWLGSDRIGNGSDDAWTGTLDNMFDFSHGRNPKLTLDPATGEKH